MAKVIKLSWDCDKSSQSFNVYRSKTPFNVEELPTPFATNVTNTYHTFVEADEDITYFLISNGSSLSEPFIYNPLAVEFPFNIPVLNNDTSSGLENWTVTDGTLQVRGGYFYGVGATLQFYQDLSIPDAYLNYLDSKDMYVNLTYLFGGWASDADKGRTGLSFIDKNSAIISTVYSPYETVYYETPDVFLSRYLYEKIPQGTVKIRIIGEGVRVQGTNLDAYWTNFKLELKDDIDAEIAYEFNMKNLEPVAYYKMDDEKNNSNALDYSSNGLNATYTAASTSYHLFKQEPLRKGSKGSMGFNVGYATSSGGTPNCVAPANPKLYNLTKGSFSICFWAKRKGNSTYWHTITQCASPSSGRDTNFRIIGNMQLQIEENSRGLSVPSMVEDELAFICYVYDTLNQTYYAYKNDTRYTGTYTPNTSGGRTVSTYFPAYYNWNYYGFKGYMSDVAFFNKALTDEQILRLYQSGKIE